MKFRSIHTVSAFLLFLAVQAHATPSTHVWAPSTDIQASGTLHLTADTYVPTQNDSSGSKPNTVTNFGITGGYWPVKDILGLEYGFDHIAGYGDLDNYPWYFNAKAGLAENAFGDFFPAIAFGGYNFGTKHNKTDANVYYAKVAKTPAINGFSLGRFSAGLFWGSNDLLLNAEGNSDATGTMLAWERNLTEVSDKLWVCVDYQGSNSGLGALAPGFSWKFADNASVLFGYVIPNNEDLAQTFTVQLDVDFDPL